MTSRPFEVDPAIRSDEENEHYTSVLFRLTDIENPAEIDQEAIEQLTAAIQAYESKHYPIPKPEGTPGGTTKIGSEEKHLDLKKIFRGNGR